MQAIEGGQIELLQERLREPAWDVNAVCEPDIYGSVAPLLLALRANDARMVELIIQHPGFDLERSLPAHGAWSWASSCSLAVLQTFLDHCACDVNRQDSDGTALLHAIVGDPHGVDKLHDLLGRAGCSVDIARQDATTPLYQAALHGNDAAVEVLLRLSVDVNNRNNDNGWTVLMVAVAQGYDIIVERLLRHADTAINARSDRGDTALHLAVERGWTHCVLRLLAQPRLDINIKNDAGWTALHAGAFANRLDALRYLCERPELEINLVDHDRQTALHWAVQAGHIEAVRLLLRHPEINLGITSRPARLTAQALAAALGHHEINRLLVEKTAGAELNDVLSSCDDYTERAQEAQPSEQRKPLIPEPRRH